jgi:hypothetical protein
LIGKRAAIAARIEHLQHPLRHLSFRRDAELTNADTRGHFHIQREGSKLNETPDLLGLGLTGVKQWIRERAKR